MKYESPFFPEDVPHLDLDTDSIAKVTLSQYNRAQIAMIKTHQYLVGLDSFNSAAFSWVKCGYAEKFRRKYVIAKKRST